ncbi:mechanosensitive ion channel family protein [Pseudosulfitobacter pseudonitzschiae]|uniref:mechanosensitive ion channel family protein n=1 Tax=Pseudosulfitobacter pseudonitzschiae TaxID=1402135 RepID=UPI001AF8B079|nr:mechanosensitive ion channel family protein [Pseudosulfitobacter pseudonitzschiae]MBM1816193.1 mechanosensitive ion channel [Pseudosulfitobacter pseudonitzschiae]MBM1833684.1 mechanosensitive ion channel [Pseudosulfitobacter pseudonitzschiae]MBM1838550.1 mechanosensitive ion channel [Pseudosulfitobacter pseudonitzschiae]MBM1842898.1 mechanosensitive ion channel [Pseudosulfitobacter pseudonitzschiae]MBM1847764.1 mechanosensitive ion channel [Pseudosulfitobacter pseudonitzschiae]
MRFVFCVWLCVLMIIGAAPPPAVAQSLFSPAASEAEPQEQEDALAETLRKAREAGLSVIVVDAQGNLITQPQSQTDASSAETPPLSPEGSALMQAQKRGAKFRETLGERLDALPDSLNEVRFILRATSPDGRIMTYVETLLISALLLFIGSQTMRRLIGPYIFKGYVTGRIKENPQGYREKMPFLVFRFFVGVGSSLIAMSIAYLLGILFFEPVTDTSLQVTILAINAAFLACRTVGDVWRMVLSPFLTQYRIPRFSDRDAKRLYRWAFYVGSLDICVVTFATWLEDFGLNYNVYAIVFGLLSLTMALINILVLVVNRHAISNAIRNGRSKLDVAWVLRAVSVWWLPVAVVYVIFGWFELAFDLVLEMPTSIPLIAGAYGVLLTILVVYGVINYLIESYFERARQIELMNAQAEAAPEAGVAVSEPDGTPEADEPAPAFAPRHIMYTYEQLARRVAGILAFVAGSYALLLIWGSATDMVEGNIFGQSLLDIMVIIFIGYIVYHAFRIWIDRKIADEQGDMVEAELGDEGGGASSASRLATLLPLFRNVMLIVVVVTIILIVLLEVGVNVGPLFAGAGFVGVAIGFGSQSLVRDVFSGAFFLFDDAFRKGEYIDVGGVKGTVEKISVRSFQLRHHLGALHTMPFGEIQVMTNYSRDWVIMKLPLRVTYDTDVEKVRKLIKKLGVELLDDPVIGENFIQPLKSQGVIQMEDSAMIIRVKFMTKPGDQWLVRKKVYEEIRALFEREGIRFAHREVTVRLADGKVSDLNEEQREAVTAAAQAAIDEDMHDAAQQETGDDR